MLHHKPQDDEPCEFQVSVLIIPPGFASDTTLAAMSCGIGGGTLWEGIQQFSKK